MTYPKTKIEIVNLILNETKDDPDFSWKNIPADKLVFDWFITGRSGSGLRLTVAGEKAFASANIAHYDFDFTVPGSPKFKEVAWGNAYISLLNEKIKCPYFLGVKQPGDPKSRLYIRIYDHRIAMLLTIYGSLETYVESLK